MSDEAADNALFPERFVPGEMHGLIEAEHLARYAWAGGHVAGRRVLDAGCGVGYGSLVLHAAGAESVTGVDISREALDGAASRAGNGIRFELGDIAELPYADASFDVVVCFEAIEHVSDQRRTLDELGRVLSPGGLLLMSSPNRDVYEEGNPHHTHEFTPEELYATLRERFSHVRLERQQAWLASLICSSETLAGEDANGSLAVDVRKLAAMSPGSETFSLAVASDAELPMMGELAMLTGLDELATWRARARSAEEHVTLSHERTLEATDAYESAQKGYEDAMATLAIRTDECLELERRLTDTAAALAKRDEELGAATDELAALRARVAKLESRLGDSNAWPAGVRASLTAPLRALGRGRRGR